MVWYAVTYLVLDPEQRFLLPPPHAVFGRALTTPAVMGPMLEALGRTVAVAMTGLVIAVVLGVAQAVVMSQWRFAEKVLYPYAVILQTSRSSRSSRSSASGWATASPPASSSA